MSVIKQLWIFKTTNMGRFSINCYDTKEEAIEAARNACDYGESYKVKSQKFLVA